MNDRVRGVSLTVAAAVVGSPTGLLVRLLDHSAWMTLLLFRAIPNLAILFAVACYSYGGPKATWRNVRGLGTRGVLAAACMASQSVAIVVALLLTKTANVFLLIQTVPVVCAVMDRFVLGEPVGLDKLMLIFLGLAGVTVVVVGQHFVAADNADGDESASKSGSTAMVGNFIALINPLSWAVYWAILRQSATAITQSGAVAATAEDTAADTAGDGAGDDTPPSTAKAPPKKYTLLALLLVAGCFHLALGVLVNAGGGFEDVRNTVRAIDAVYYILFGAVLVPMAQLLFSMGPRYVSTTTVGCCKLVEVPLAPLWVFLLDGEMPEWTTLLGGAIIVLAIVAHAVAATRTNKK